MKVENGKITECTESELFDYWLKRFDSVYTYEQFKLSLIKKGVRIVGKHGGNNEKTMRGR